MGVPDSDLRPEWQSTVTKRAVTEFDFAIGHLV